MDEKPNWYQRLSMAKRRKVNRLVAKQQLARRQRMTGSEREAIRAKWREQKQRQRKAA